MKNKKYFCRPLCCGSDEWRTRPVTIAEAKEFKEIDGTDYDGVWRGTYEEIHPHNGDSFDCHQLLFDSVERLDWYYALAEVSSLEDYLKDAKKNLAKCKKKMEKKHGKV